MSVEKQANKRLDELTLLLDLDEDQKDFIFPILAVCSLFSSITQRSRHELLNGIKTSKTRRPLDIVESIMTF